MSPYQPPPGAVSPTYGRLATFEDVMEIIRIHGVGGGVGNAFTRDTALITTISLAHAARESSTATFASAAAFRVMRVVTDIPARLRLYTTTAARDADITRLPGDTPTGNHGLMLDVLTVTGMLTIDLSPEADCYLPGTAGTVPYTIDNLSGSEDTVTATLTYLRTE